MVIIFQVILEKISTLSEKTAKTHPSEPKKAQVENSDRPIIKKKQKFLSTPEILTYIKGLTYSRYLTMVNDVSLNSTSSDNMNVNNSIINNSTNSNKKSNINLDNYL